jgi:hypothetical protein
MFVTEFAPCVACSLLAEGFEGERGHAHLEPINSTTPRLRCRECGVAWEHDVDGGWEIHDPDGELEGFIPTDRAVRARVARA